MAIWQDYNFIKAEDYNPTTEFNLVKKNSKKQFDIVDDFIVFDTETSHNHNEEEPIGWIYQFALLLGNDIVYGRNPLEFVKVLKKIKKFYDLNENKKMYVFCHNLPYDWQYLKNFIIKEFGNDYELLASSAHKIFDFEISGFIFRCSYKLSNKSLDKWSKDLGTPHKKLVGEINYDLIRNQNTPLTRKDWKYQFYDIIVLKECLIKQMEIYNDNLRTLPLTSTGYIRRTARKFFKEKKSYIKNYNDFVKSSLNKETYCMLLNESAGGITHGNFLLAGKKVKGKIAHYDFRSHYPSQMRVKDFPISGFSLYYKFNKEKKKILTKEGLLNLQEKYCFVADIAIRKLELKKHVTMPYLQTCKVLKGLYEKNSRIISDNGRVLKCNNPFKITVNEIDLKWLIKQYNFEAVVLKVFVSKKGKLPEFLIKTVDFYFKGKTEYKEKVKEMKRKYEKNECTLPELLDAEINLMKSKNGLNGIFGCTFTKPVREDFYMDEKGKWHKGTIIENDDGTIERKEVDIQVALNEYYNNRNNFMRFQFGCWITAHARDELLTIIEKIGYDNFVYCDTDSVFCLSNKKTEKIITDYNMKVNEIAKEKGAFIEFNNKKIYYDVLENEKEDIREFKFLHAKCYGSMIFNSIKNKEELNVVIAGVTRFSKNGKISREIELGSLDNLKENFTFKKCGGTRSIYTEHLIDSYNNNIYSSACIICDTEKTLSGNTIDGIDFIIGD